MILQGLQGRQDYDSGTQNPFRQNEYGSLIAEQGGKYAEATRAGRVFSIANQDSVAVTATIATTWTGLGVGNPSGSGIKIIMLQFGFSNKNVAQQAGVIGLMVSATSLTASLTPVNRLSGGVASSAIATAGQEIATPVVFDIVGSYGTANTNTIGAANAQVYNIDGSLVLDEGQCVTAFFTLDSTASFLLSFLWEERDA